MSNESFYHFNNRVAGRFVCFCGGFVDSAGYVILHGVFTASVTGNIVKFSSAAAHNSFAQTCAVVSFAYGTGSAIVRILSQYLSHLNFDTDVIGIFIFALEAFLLFIAIIVGTSFETSIGNYNEMHTLITGIIMALPMGCQFAAASASFPQFPNTTGMTASVATSSSALANIFLLYLSESGVIHFYLTKGEREVIESAETPEGKVVAKQTVYDLKKETAFDELDRQMNPLLYFTFGCVCGVLASEAFGFKCLIVHIGVVLFLISEVLLARNSQSVLKDIKEDNDSSSSDGNEDELISQEKHEKHDRESPPIALPHKRSLRIHTVYESPRRNGSADGDDRFLESNETPTTISTTTQRSFRVITDYNSPRSFRRTSISGIPYSTTPRGSSPHQRALSTILSFGISGSPSPSSSLNRKRYTIRELNDLSNFDYES